MNASLLLGKWSLRHRGLCCLRMLCVIGWQLVTDIVRKAVSPIFKGQAVQEHPRRAKASPTLWRKPEMSEYELLGFRLVLTFNFL